MLDEIVTNNSSSDSSTAVAEVMQRLSSKSTVIAVLAIDQKTSSVLASSGQTSIFGISKGTNTSTSLDTTTEVIRPSGVDEFATMIWNYVNHGSKMVLKFDEENELKLLRIRTKRYELVIVPSSKFIFAVAHELRT